MVTGQIPLLCSNSKPSYNNGRGENVFKKVRHYKNGDMSRYTILDRKLSLAKIAAADPTGAQATESYRKWAEQNSIKWSKPGWRIEKKYDNTVKLGNWFEEGCQYRKDGEPIQTTHRADYMNCHQNKDPSLRHRFESRNMGLQKQYMFKHHGDHYRNNYISGYDENFTLRESKDKRPLRKWDQHKLKWAPENSDYPMQGEGTMFGLREKLEKTASRDNEAIEGRVRNSMTSDSYVKHPSYNVDGYKIKATPKPLSSKLNPISQLNKNLKLRGNPCMLVPEFSPEASGLLQRLEEFGLLSKQE